MIIYFDSHVWILVYLLHSHRTNIHGSNNNGIDDRISRPDDWSEHVSSSGKKCYHNWHAKRKKWTYFSKISFVKLAHTYLLPFLRYLSSKITKIDLSIWASSRKICSFLFSNVSIIKQTFHNRTIRRSGSKSSK